MSRCSPPWQTSTNKAPTCRGYELAYHIRARHNEHLASYCLAAKTACAIFST